MSTNPEVDLHYDEARVAPDKAEETIGNFAARGWRCTNVGHTIHVVGTGLVLLRFRND